MHPKADEQADLTCIAVGNWWHCFGASIAGKDLARLLQQPHV